MYGLHGSLKAHPGQRDALVGHLLEGARALQDFEGCYLYVVSEDAADPDVVWVTEVWESQEAHRASLALEAVQALIAAARSLLAALPEGGMELVPVGGKGLDGRA